MVCWDPRRSCYTFRAFNKVQKSEREKTEREEEKRREERKTDSRRDRPTFIIFLGERETFSVRIEACILHSSECTARKGINWGEIEGAVPRENGTTEVVREMACHPDF